MKLLLDNLILTPSQNKEDIIPLVKEQYDIDELISITILRKSLDARDKGNIYYRYRIVIDVSDGTGHILLNNDGIELYEEKIFSYKNYNGQGLHAVIVGSGPAGIFCALKLIESGATVDILERGKPVDERLKDIFILEEKGILNKESNILFGEGGAGTYSDGKLTTRINRPEVKWVFEKLVQFGAPDSILYDAKPHLGSDVIRDIVKRMRNWIIESGSKIHFNEKVTDLVLNKKKVTGVITGSGKEYSSDRIVLATGHSARDIYSLLQNKNILLEQKGFAVGVRIEHPADYINDIQYGKSRFKKSLPAADYRLAFNNRKSKRGIYSFCMCPGGVIINSSSEENEICTNGMSLSGRDGKYSNAAIVVSVHTGDAGEDNLDGIEFQRQLEREAFKHGDTQFIAPAQRVTSFMKGIIDKSLPPVSYKPGVKAANINDYLPHWISDEIKTALNVFDRKMKGFINDNGILIGIETKTSSPVRIVRDSNYESVSHQNLYPAGEGAGYAGGITSSAVDGIRVAESILHKYQ